MNANPFEALFHAFVDDFGGEVITPPPTGRSADYYFGRQNIIAELKTLTEDITARMDAEMNSVIQQWIAINGPLPVGTKVGDQIVLEMPPGIREGWLKPVLRTVDHLIGDANRQIRDTKARKGTPSAKGVVLISNVGNPYFTQPKVFRDAIVETLRKRTATGALRYPEIHGAVYFSFGDIRSLDRDQCFWAPAVMQHSEDEDVSALQRFQVDLRNGWIDFLNRNITPVRFHGSQDDPPRAVFVHVPGCAGSPTAL